MAIDFVSVADLLETRFDRALSRLDCGDAPVWGVGHSLGALAQVLISSRHPAGRRRGQILVSHTRRGEESLPVVRAALKANPVLGPLLSAMDVGAASDFLLKGAELVERALPPVARRGRREATPSSAPSPVRDVAPLLQQMLPLLREVGVEQDRFRPNEDQFVSAIQRGYRDRDTLLLRLGGDGLDETAALAAALAALPADRLVDFSYKVLRGQHLVPLLPDWEGVAPFGGSPVLPQSVLLPRDRWEEAAEDQRLIVDAIDSFLRERE